jgi:hypothetical protein
LNNIFRSEAGGQEVEGEEHGGGGGGGGGEWYRFNDSHVSKIIDESDIVNPTGYILFYKRRELSSANVINLSM